MNKAIWCRGCSFTFGEGLQYFSDFSNITIPDGQTWYEEYLTYTQHRYIQQHRYSKLLAEKLNTVDINGSENGGTNKGIYNSLKKLLEPKNKENCKILPYYIDEHYVDLEEIGLIVIQFTDLFRDHIEIDNIVFPPAGIFKDKFDFFDAVMANNITFEDFCEKVAEKTVNEFAELFKEIEKKAPNIIVRVFNWFPEMDKPLRTHEYFKDKVLTFEINNVSYTNFKEMIYAKVGITVEETFYPKLKNDQHFNLNGQKLIADTIYDSIKDEWKTKVINSNNIKNEKLI
jgi:hypothetical protein